MRRVLAISFFVLIASQLFAADAANWVEPMKKVHANFKGKPGAIAQYGDSITITMAFFAPLLYDIKEVPAELAGPYQTMKKYVRPECWRDWKGPANGNEGGTTSDWGLKGMDGWLKKQNPEIALIMWGTNDSKHGDAGTAYKTNMAQIVDKVLANGTIPVLFTIPPRGDQAGNTEVSKRMEGYVQAVREIAAEKNIPLIDFYKEILDRQPENFAKTLLGDQLHPSYPEGHQNKFDEESLKLSGYTLRNFLTLKAFAQIYAHILEKK